MFTIKQRSYRLIDGSDKLYDQIELIDGPFDLVSKEMDDGWIVVHAHRGEDMIGTSFGPYKHCEQGQPRPTLWVMNGAGATVATYHL